LPLDRAPQPAWRCVANEDKVMIDPPAIATPETELLTDTGKTFAPMIEGNDEAPENTMDEYPEYWIG
jgi:hypothetical protein